MSFQTFELGGVEIPIFAVTQFRQTYQQLGGEFLARMMDGTGKKQRNWSKMATEISGTGTIPVPLFGLDYTTTMTLKCAARRSIAGATEVITLPVERRTDAAHLPYGMAMLADRTQVPSTIISIISDVATLTTVAGAVQYIVYYYPEITVWAFEPQENVNVLGAEFGWVLRAEET